MSVGRRVPVQTDIVDMVPLMWLLVAAYETGLLRRLLIGSPASASVIAADLALSESALERALAVLAEAGFVHLDGATVRATDSFTAIDQMVPGGFNSQVEQWSHIANYLRTGVLAPTHVADIVARRSVYPTTSSQLATLFEEPAALLAQELGTATGSILDVGAGSGVWSLAMARGRPGIRVIGVDLPEVVEVFCQHAAQLGMIDQIEVVAGDYHTVDLPSECGLAILANVLHLETPAKARALLTRTSHAVTKAGVVVVVDAFDDRSPAARLAQSLYHLSLGLRSGTGGVIRFEQIEAWAAELGFRSTRWIPLGTRRLLLGAAVLER